MQDSVPKNENNGQSKRNGSIGEHVDVRVQITKLLPAFSKKEKQDIIAYNTLCRKCSKYYTRHIVKEQEIPPAWNAILDKMLKDENMMEYREKISGELSDDAILNHNWNLYLESLILLGEECAKAGVGFKELYEIIAIIKKYIIPLAQKKYINKPNELISIMNGMNLFLDNTMTIIGEAYNNEVKNITTSRERELFKQKAESVYVRSLIEASLDPFITIDTKGKISDVNEAMLKITGFKREEILGTEFSDYFTEPARATKGYCHVFEAGFIANYPLTVKHKDGKLTDVICNASCYRGIEGKVLGIFASLHDITEQKHTEEKLLEYKFFFNNNYDLACIANMDGYFEILNPNWETKLGYKNNELFEKSFMEFIHPDDIKPTLKEVEKLQKGATTINFKNRYRKSDGSYISLVWDTTPNLETGKLYGIAHDITNEEQASRYARSLIEASLDPLVTISAEGKITDVNEASVKVTGVSRKKLIGTDFSNYFTEPEKAKEGYMRVFKEGFVANYPLTIKHISGKLTDVLYNASVYKDDKGEVLGVFAAARDITERRKFEKALQKSEENYRIIFENSPLGIMTADINGRIIEINPNLLSLLGSPSVEATKGFNVLEFQPLVDAGIADIFKKSIETGEPIVSENLYTSKWGKQMFAKLYVKPIKNENNIVTELQVIVEDITERKQLEKEAAERKIELVRLEELEKFRKLTVGRELKMIELKKEIEELKSKLQITEK